jgi:hypothetical protein
MGPLRVKLVENLQKAAKSATIRYVRRSQRHGLQNSLPHQMTKEEPEHGQAKIS